MRDASSRRVDAFRVRPMAAKQTLIIGDERAKSPDGPGRLMRS